MVVVVKKQVLALGSFKPSLVVSSCAIRVVTRSRRIRSGLLFSTCTTNRTWYDHVQYRKDSVPQHFLVFSFLWPRINSKLILPPTLSVANVDPEGQPQDCSSNMNRILGFAIPCGFASAYFPSFICAGPFVHLSIRSRGPCRLECFFAISSSINPMSVVSSKLTVPFCPRLAEPVEHTV